MTISSFFQNKIDLFMFYIWRHTVKKPEATDVGLAVNLAAVVACIFERFQRRGMARLTKISELF